MTPPLSGTCVVRAIHHYLCVDWLASVVNARSRLCGVARAPLRMATCSTARRVWVGGRGQNHQTCRLVGEMGGVASGSEEVAAWTSGGRGGDAQPETVGAEFQQGISPAAEEEGLIRAGPPVASSSARTVSAPFPNRAFSGPTLNGAAPGPSICAPDLHM